MAKDEFLAYSSSAIKQVCLPVWEAAFFTFLSGVLVTGFVSLGPPKIVLASNLKLIIIDKRYRTNLKATCHSKGHHG